jgi:hypothetical protein
VIAITKFPYCRGQPAFVKSHQRGTFQQHGIGGDDIASFDTELR